MALLRLCNRILKRIRCSIVYSVPDTVSGAAADMFVFLEDMFDFLEIASSGLG
jgi:hypothetical protein